MLLGINLLLLVELMLPGIHLLLAVLVNVVEGDFINTLIKGFIQSLNRFQYLLYPLIINPNSISFLIIKTQHNVEPKFAETHNLVAFLEKPEESDGFEGIVNFLNASSIRYALTVNPTNYTSCIKQFWATAKAKTINEEVHIQALVDGKKVIVTETSVKRALQLKDAEGTECLRNATIFEQLTLMGAKTTAWSEFSSTMASAIICLATNQKFKFSKYIFDNMVNNLEGGVKFIMYPRFVQVFLDKQVEGMTKHKKIYVTPSHTKKVFANMKRGGKGFPGRVTPLVQTMMVQAPEELEPITDEATNKEHVPIHSNDPLLSGEDRLKLNELIELCTNLSQRVLDLENTKTSQATEITNLMYRVKKLESRNKSRILGLKRLRQVGRSIQVVSSKDEDLGDQEDASKLGRKIANIDADEEVTLIDETQTLIEIKVAKPKAVTTIATTTTTAVTRPKARGVVVQEPKPEKPLKKKDQILIDEEVAQKLQAQLNVELEEEDKLAKQREEDANIVE
ncbi:hypothetical protein Tco_1435666 [Tanacetum coccineum]